MRKVAKKRRPTRHKKQSKLLRLSKFLFNIIKVPKVATILGILAICSWFYYSGNYQSIIDEIQIAKDAAAKKSGLVLKDILLEGQEHTPKEDILNTMTNNGKNNIAIGEPIVDIDLWDIKRNLEQLTWVRYASVERQYPSTLSVSIIERTPAALWQNKGKLYLIDSEGEVINTKTLEDFSDLIIMVGKEAPSHTQSLLGMINSEPDLAGRVSSAIRISKRRWNIRLNNGIEIKLPEEEPTKAWSYLAKMQNDTRILDTDIKDIDLRVEEKMFVR